MTDLRRPFWYTDARKTGLLFFFWILTGLFSLMYIPSKINFGGEGAEVAQSVLAHESLFRTGMIMDLVSGVLWIFIALSFYRIFKPVDGRLARLLLAFVIVQLPVVFLMEAFSMASLMIFKGELLTAFGHDEALDLAILFFKFNDYGTIFLEAYWGLWLFPLALLIIKSGFIPKLFGYWLIINGIAYLVLSIVNIMVPEYGNLVYKFAFPAFFGELALMLWLVIMGVKR